MATSNLTIKQFLGLNVNDAGDTQLKIGELSFMENFAIVNGYKLKKRFGYTPILNTPLGSTVNGQWYGKLNEKYFHLVASGGHIYNIDGLESEDLGSLSLFVKARGTADTAIDSTTGGTTASSGNYASEYIPVYKDLYTISGHAIAQAAGNLGLAWYDSSKTYISGTSFGGVTGNGTYQRPITAAYVRYTVKTTDADNSMFLADGSKVEFMQFGDAVYIQDGSKYMKFDGVESVDLTRLSFNSAVSGITYPYSMTLKAGKYRFNMAGGKGKDFVVGGVTKAYGGKGGEVSFDLTLSADSVIQIKKVEVTGNEGYGTSYWVYADGVLLAAVGGGGNADCWNHSTYGWTSGMPGGDGGTDSANYGGDNNVEDGKGASYGIGGLAGTYTNYGYGTGGNGNPGKNFDDATNPGKGGASATEGIGGCGYAGGGGGAYSYPSWGVRRGAGGGGSSYVKPTGITVLKNTKGTNNGAASMTIAPIWELGTITEVTGYTPTIVTGAKPDLSVSTSLEYANILTGTRTSYYNGDGTSTLYKLPEKSNYSVDSVYVDGVLKTVTTHYTVNATKDEITFTSGNIPANGTNNVQITWTHTQTNDRLEVTKQNFARRFGGKNDTRLFLYGNGNRIVYSDLANGVPSAEYFPVVNTLDVGTSQYDVTGLSLNYDRMIIHTEGAAWWTQYDYDTTLGLANFPVYPLNDAIGQSCKGVERVCLNLPYVIYKNQVYYFYASNVRDERNAVHISKKIESLLNELDMSNVITLDYEKMSEYVLIVGNEAYIYNYALEVWYKYKFADSVVSACIVGDYPVIATADGHLYQFNVSALYDNLTNISAEAETGWIDYNLLNKTKFLNTMWLQTDSRNNTDLDVYVQTDDKPEKLVKEIRERHMDFADVDFADFSFNTSYNPKGYRIKAKAKKFVYIKYKLVSNLEYGATVLSIVANVSVGGNAK